MKMEEDENITKDVDDKVACAFPVWVTSLFLNAGF